MLSLKIVRITNGHSLKIVIYYNHSKGTAGPPSEGWGRTGKHLYRPPTPANMKEVHTMNTDTMNAKVQELRELKRMAAELADEISSIEDEIKRHMDTHGMDTLLGFDWRITWKTVTSSRVDTTALKKALPDVAERFMKATTTRRFVLV